MRPPLSLPLAPPGDAPSAFVIFCSENTKIQVQQATPKVPPFTGRTIPPRYVVPSSNLLLCVFGCSPSWRGSHRPRACWLFWQCSYPPLKRCKARRTFRSFVPPLTEHLWTRFQTPITITVRQHRTYSYATVSSGYERARGTHASTTCKPSAAGSIVDQTKGPRRGGVAAISRGRRQNWPARRRARRNGPPIEPWRTAIRALVPVRCAQRDVWSPAMATTVASFWPLLVPGLAQVHVVHGMSRDGRAPSTWRKKHQTPSRRFLEITPHRESGSTLQ